MKIEFQSICDQGAVRPNNEDAIRFGVSTNQQLVWMVVADGMGGHLSGEVASEMQVSEIESAINQISNLEDIDWLCWIEIEINRANNKIFSSAKNTPSQNGMGTTVVIAILFQGQCYIGWVGDSRCYLYREADDNPLQQITQDHTMVQALLDKGAITAKEAEQSNNKNMLSKAIGIRNGVAVDTKLVSIQDQDILLLSTDGLHDSLKDSEIKTQLERLSKHENIEQTLLKLAISHGSKDNITFGSIFIKQIK